MYGRIISNFAIAGIQSKLVFGSQFLGGSQNAVRRSIGLYPGSQCNTQRCPEYVSPVIQFDGVNVPWLGRLRRGQSFAIRKMKMRRHSLNMK